MLQALPEDRSLRPFCQLMVKFEMFDLVAAQNGFDNATVALGKNIAQREQLIIIGQTTRHRLAVLAHMTLVAVGR